MKRILITALSLLLVFSLFTIYTSAEVGVLPVDTNTSDEDTSGTDFDESATTSMSPTPPELDVPAAILMEATTGKILYQHNASSPLPPASVTKIMTLLLVMEDLAAGLIHLDDMVTISAYASSMGGSQVFLAEGEHMTLEDLLKCTIIASANDAAVALAEYVSGSESAFVTRMNERAKELGATTANFENATGLDDDTISHVMSALDIAIISKELVKHSKILEYSSVWMDSIRNGEFTLTNTNRLIRYYDGATGLKTGSTDKAKFCMTATAERNQMPLIAVIMGAESRDARNNAAKSLLDWGFANFALYEDAGKEYDPVQVKRGEKDHVSTCAPNFSQVVLKTDLNQITKQISLTPFANATVEQGSELGKISYLVNGEIIGTVPIYAKEAVGEITFWGVVGRMLKIFALS